MWHPWKALRERLDLALIWTENLPRNVLGATDGTRIWMTPRQLQAERRCTLTHELIHVERGHAGCQPPAVELEVRVEAARRLIPFDDLVRACLWARGPQELADELWVDEATLDDRLTHLTEDERTEINAALARRDARDA
ncbi:ImmA/IrrE family metallo-endopeptidase [Actinomyces culturomici]|uniref:ImmA/IrrE family metallo-endopeptidase n=1 Tax=Actinomyces culturomici TaxID=1926276 RepID=UPI00135AC9C0|nr:ImmA/IrrE family metallo-endopeptidase [Actinomyces culturomici]